MYLQHFGLESSPFTRKPSPDVFFAQAGRKDILKNLRDNLQQGETAMLLTGPQGAGKTIICRLIQHRLDGSSYKVISLEDPAGSFDDLLTKVCLKLGMPSDGDAEQDITSVLRRLIRQQNEQGRSVLLLIDEAEKMFLAALERLFRLLNELHETFGTQVLLVGRSALSTSIEQLSGYCEDVRMGAAYSLADFSFEETGAYLAFRLKAAGDGRGTDEPIFSEGAVQEIFRLGQGLPGLIDGIAESSLEKAAAAGEQTVLPTHVVAPDDTAPPPLAEDEEERKGYKGLLLFLLVLCLIAFLFWGKTSFFTERQETSQEAVQEDIGVRPENTEISIGPAQDEPLPFVEEEGDDSSEESADSTQPAETPPLFGLPVPERPSFRKKDDAPEISGQKTAADQETVQPRQEAAPEVLAPEQAVIAEPQAEQHDERQVEQQGEKKSAGGEAEGLPESVEEPTEEPLQTAEGRNGDKSETLASAKKLPVIKPALIVELTPGMKKTRPAVHKDVAPAPATDEKDETDKSDVPDAPESRPETEKTVTESATAAENEAATQAAAAPPQQKTLVPVASVRVTPRATTTPAVSVPQQPPIPPPAAADKETGDDIKTPTTEKAAPVSETSPPATPPLTVSPPVAADKDTKDIDTLRTAKIIPVPEIKITSVPPALGSAPADRLFARYLGAGNRWNKKDYGNKFTVQLLVLSADDAEENVKKMIVRDEYQEHKTTLYILRRNTLPPTLFVCYGVYSSMDAARTARNAMPLFLRKHHPYALSISDVLSKARD